MMKNEHFISFQPVSFTKEEMLERSASFLAFMDRRRSIRDFSAQKVDQKVLENIILTASSAPSGAHKQPWTFCLISNKEMKSKMRALAEKEEFENYHGRMSEGWLKDLEKFGTDHIKEFIDVAPYIIVVMKQVYSMGEEGQKMNNYYVNESVGIAVGFLLAAIHNAGLVALTHTPSPMNFLEKLLERPPNERAYLLIPVGMPKDGALVPDIKRKGLNEVMKVYK